MFGGETDRAVLSFEPFTLPAKAVITGVTLRVRRARVDGRVDAVLVDVHPAALGVSRALEQADFDAKAARPDVARFTPPAADGEWVEVALPLDVVAANATGGLQVRLRAVTPTGFEANRLVLHGGEEGALGPHVVVTFRP